MKEEMDQITDKMKKAKCEWPGCNKKNMVQVSLQVMKQTDKGLEPADGTMKDAAVPVPLCMYHLGIAQTGLCAVVQNPKNPKEFSFIAPVEAVHLTESVINAMGMTGHLKKLVFMKDEAEAKMKQMEEEVEKENNENQKKNDEPEGNECTDKPRKQ